MHKRRSRASLISHDTRSKKRHLAPSKATLKSTLKELQGIEQGCSCEVSDEVLSFLRSLDLSEVNSHSTTAIALEARVDTALCFCHALRIYAPEPPFTKGKLVEFFKYLTAIFSIPLHEEAEECQPLIRSLLKLVLYFEIIGLLPVLPEGTELACNLLQATFNGIATMGTTNQILLAKIVYLLVAEFKNTQLSILRLAEVLLDNMSIQDQSRKWLAESLLQESEPLVLACKNELYDLFKQAATGLGDSCLRATRRLETILLACASSSLNIIADVTGQLLDFLVNDRDQLRILSVKIVGKMLQHPGFLQTHPSALKAWTERCNDRSTDIRAELGRQLPFIMSKMTFDEPSAENLVQAICLIIEDPDEQVRLNVITALKDVDVYMLPQVASSQRILKCLILACQDKKPLVLKSAFETIAVLFENACETNDPSVVDYFQEVVCTLHKYSFAADPAMREEARNVLEQNVYGLFSGQKRIHRILCITRLLLTDDSFEVMKSFLKTQLQCVQLISNLSRENEKCDALLKSISSMFINSESMYRTLSKVIEVDDGFSKLHSCVNPLSTFDELLISRDALLSELPQEDEIKLCLFFRRVTAFLPTSDVLDSYVDEWSDNTGKEMDRAHSTVLELVSKFMPEILAPFHGKLLHILRTICTSIGNGAMCKQELILILKVINRIYKHKDGNIVANLKGIALPDLASSWLDSDCTKQIARFMKCTYSRERLTKIATEKFELLNHEQVDSTDLVVLTELCGYSPSATQLFNSSLHYLESRKCYDDITLQCLKIITSVLRSDKLLRSVSSLAIQRLMNFLEKAMSLECDYDNFERRGQFALQILKLAKIPRYDKFMSNKQIFSLRFSVDMRVNGQYILLKISDYLKNGELPSRYIPLLFCAVTYPSPALKESIIARVKRLQTRKANYAVERSITRMLCQLALYREDVLSCITPIMFAIECIATPQNVSLLYSLCDEIKGHFALEDPSNERIYHLSEIACLGIQMFAQKKHWKLSVVRCHVDLPDDCFVQLTSDYRRNEITEKVWLGGEESRLISKVLSGHIVKGVDDVIAKTNATKKTRKQPKAASLRAAQKPGALQELNVNLRRSTRIKAPVSYFEE